jgi:hypothetical protein
MRGGQLARQWRIIRAIGASPNGLTVADVAQREGIGLRTIYRDLISLQEAGFPLYTERFEKAHRWMFVDTYKFKVPPPFTSTRNGAESRVTCPGSEETTFQRGAHSGKDRALRRCRRLEEGKGIGESHLQDLLKRGIRRRSWSERSDQACCSIGDVEYRGRVMVSHEQMRSWVDKSPGSAMIPLGVAPRPTRRKARTGLFSGGGFHEN